MSRIGIDASRLGVRYVRTGTETYTWQLLQALGVLDRRRRYLLYTNGPAHLPPLPANFRVRDLPFPRLWTHLRLSLEMAQNPPDLLFVPAHVLPPVRPRRTLVTVHDLGYRYAPEGHTLFQRLYLELSTRWNARVATRVLALSHGTRQDLIRFYRIPPERIVVVHPGVDHARFHPLPPDLVRRRLEPLGLRPGYFLFVGTVQPRKNLMNLVYGYIRARRGREAFPPLVVAGRRGWKAAGLEALLARTPGVVRLGYVPDRVLPVLYNGALALALPSRFEGFGLPVLEALACGTPVLASRAGGLPEAVGEGGILVDPDDVGGIAEALERLAGDEALRARLGRAGRAHARAFRWSEAARRVLDQFALLGV